MEEFLKYLKSQGWTIWISTKVDGKKSIVVYSHPNNDFALWADKREETFEFKSLYRGISMSTGVIKFHSISHFELFNKQTKVLTEKLK